MLGLSECLVDDVCMYAYAYPITVLLETKHTHRGCLYPLQMCQHVHTHMEHCFGYYSTRLLLPTALMSLMALVSSGYQTLECKCVKFAARTGTID